MWLMARSMKGVVQSSARPTGGHALRHCWSLELVSCRTVVSKDFPPRFHDFARLVCSPRVVSICEIPVAMEDRIPVIQPVQTTMGIPQTQHTEQSIDVPIEPQQQIPTAPPLQTTVEEPMVQRIDEHFEKPMCTVRRVPLLHLVQTTMEVPQAQRVEREYRRP